MKHHIITTGVSLLQNYCNTQNPRLSDLGLAVQQHKNVENFLNEDPEKASAELNSLHKRTNFLDASSDQSLAVTLIFTETNEGRCVSSLLENFLNSRGVEVNKIPVKGFDKPALDVTPEFAQAEASDALIKLRDGVCEHIRKLRTQPIKRDIELNCTGGFKAEVAILYAIGIKMEVPVYYLHETFRVCITLPDASKP